MNLRTVHLNDHVLVDVKGKTFEARVRSLPGRDEGERLVGIDPLVSWASWRFCSPRAIRRKLPAGGETA